MTIRMLGRYYRMFAISMEDALQARSLAFLWFLYGLINTMSVLLLWIAGFAAGGVKGDMGLPYVQLYYVLILVGNSALMSHVEESVARYDIKEGQLVKHLLKPISYYWYRFSTEIPWRFLGGFFSLIGLLIFSLLFRFHVPTPTPLTLMLLPLVLIFSIMLSFTYKMALSLSAFWITEGWALFEVMEAMVIIIAGYVMPLSFFPLWIQRLALALPFAYMVYLPVQMLTGQLSVLQLFQGIGMQVLWLTVLVMLYKFAWKKGIPLFTGVGQ